MIDFVLENTRHQPCEHHLKLFALHILKSCLDLDRPLNEAHIVIIADTTFPSEALVWRESCNAWVYDGLERLVLTSGVPVLPCTHEEKVHVCLADLSGSDAHATSFPEPFRRAQCIFAQVDRVEHFIFNREGGDAL